MNISSSGINFSTIPTQVKKLVETIHERTKNWFSSEIISVKNTHISLNEKLDIGKTSPIEIALPDKIKEFFQPKDKNTLNKTLVTVKNITDTNNTCKKNISEEISLPNGVWSSRTQTLQSLSDDQLYTIHEQSRASLHNPSPQSYSKVTIDGREYSVTYHPQDDLFAVERINGCQGRLVQWLYNMAGHPRGQITWQLTYQLNSPNS
ncbi:Chimeric type III secretion system effector protein [Salmonella enterica subsp. salamae]|nr:hypothetical protein [Salmonella enterica]SQH94365.1 Chimeric type III secretion system effector protein [Salmonella enterica subsp. salamae]